jgi:hypothetical protein
MLQEDGMITEDRRKANARTRAHQAASQVEQLAVLAVGAAALLMFLMV